MTTTAKPQRSIDELFHDFIQGFILVAAVVCWVLEAVMNFNMGAAKHFLLGLVFVSIAVFAAYLPIAIRNVPWGGWRDFAGTFQKAWRIVFLALCIAVSQAAGWANIGTMLADAGTKRDTQATSLSSAKEKLDRDRAERKKIGVTRTVGTIEAALNLELRKTSKQYPNGDGPEAMKLKGELSTAMRAAELDALIPKLAEGLETKDQVAEGKPDVDVMARIFRANTKDIEFWYPVALTAVIGLFANFGFVIAGVGVHKAAPAMPRPAGYLPRSGDLVDHLAGDANPGPFPRGPHGGAYPWEPQASHFEHARSPVSHAAPQPSVVVMPQAGDRPAAAHSQPITINVSGAPGAARQSSEASPESVAGRRHVRRPGVAAPGDRMRPAGDIIDVTPSPLAPQRPVDRSQIEQIIDRLLVFKSACLQDARGSVVPADQVYQRYVEWSHGRAIAQPAFETMLPLAGVTRIEIAGVPHYIDVTLRGAQRQLAVVGG